MHWIALPLPGYDEPLTPSAVGLQTATRGWWALRFTPRVALVDDSTVLLEVSTTERLWGGQGALLAQVLQAWTDGSGRGCTDLAAAENASAAGANPPNTPNTPRLVWGRGPTALEAQARLRLALTGRTLAGQEPGLERLPLHTLTALRPHVASLERMGCRTWGALRALPRAGVARRFGAGALRVLDQAFGDAPETHRWLELPEQFALTAELPALAQSAQALLWSANRCLAALQGWLQARQQGALGLELTWRHDLRRIDGVAIAPTQTLQVRTAQATQDMAHLRRLLAENLARTTLAAPACQITLRLLEAAPLPHCSASLLPPGDGGDRGDGDEQGEALHQLLERLSARLGPGHVQAPVLQADHRPECMQQWRPAAEVLGHARAHARIDLNGTHSPKGLSGAHAPDADLWPTWLVHPPRRLAVQGNRPCHHGLLRLLAGPHRFEAGWWSAQCGAQDALLGAHGLADSGPGLALRDYFVAHNAVAGLVWVFRERSSAPQTGGVPAAAARWFLHGVFG